MCNNTDLAWAAGIIDGEGCIQATYAQNGNAGGYRVHRFKLEVNNTDPRMILRLLEIFDVGSVSTKGSRGGEYRPNERTLHTWNVCGKYVGPVLRMVLPYLVVKREQAELGIQLSDTVGRRGVPVSDEVCTLRFALSDELKALKHVEYPNLGKEVV